MAAPMDMVMSFYSTLELLAEDLEEDMLMNHLFTLNTLIVNNSGQYPIPELPKIKGYAEIVVSKYCSDDFRYHYRLSLESFDLLFNMLEPYLIEDVSGRGISSVEPKKKVLIFVWYMSTQESMREIAHLFGISISTTHNIKIKLLDNIMKLADKIITWLSAEEQQNISRKLQEDTGILIDGIIGCIDGTHIRLNHRFKQDQDYICRKKFPSIQLQLVVDPSMKILNFNTGWPGCVNDGRVLKNSILYQKAERGDLFENGKFIIGDSAYPVKRWLMPVIKDNNRLTDAQRKYNRCLASIRQVIERAIGHLKGRFRRLRCIHIYTNGTASKIISATCILHNICISTHDELEDFMEEDINRNQNRIGINVQGIENDEDGLALQNRLLELFN